MNTTKPNTGTGDNQSSSKRPRLGTTLASVGVICLLLGIVFYSGALYALIDNVIAQVGAPSSFYLFFSYLSLSLTASCPGGRQ